MKLLGHHSTENAFFSITGSDQLRKSFDWLVQTSLPLPVSSVPKTGGVRDKVGCHSSFKSVLPLKGHKCPNPGFVFVPVSEDCTVLLRFTPKGGNSFSLRPLKITTVDHLASLTLSLNHST